MGKVKQKWMKEDLPGDYYDGGAHGGISRSSRK